MSAACLRTVFCRSKKLGATVLTGFRVSHNNFFLATLGAWLAAPLVDLVFKNENVTTAYRLLLPGLFAFSLNKYLLAVLNGARYMRAFAVLQSSRYILILFALLIFIANERQGELLTFVITFAELVLLPILLIYVFFLSGIFEKGSLKLEKFWLKIHFEFGVRVFLSSAISELNTRVDVLMVGAFLGDVKAGIYSIAILLAEGLSQFSVVVRNNINPLLTRFILENKLAELKKFGRKISLYFFLFMLISGCSLLMLYPFSLALLSTGKDFYSAYSSLIILTIGLIIAAPYLPFNMILSQADKPSQQTVFALATVGLNIVLNAIAIPLVGIEGAALATSLSYICSVFLLIYMSKKVLRVTIWI